MPELFFIQNFEEGKALSTKPIKTVTVNTISKPLSQFGFTLAEPVGHGHQHTVDNLDLLKRKRNVASSP